MRPPFRFLLLSLIAAAITAPAQAAITYSGVQSITITNTFDGVFVDFTNPLDATAFTTSATDPGAGNWDINPFFGGAAIGSSPTFEVSTDDGTTNSTVMNLGTSDVVGDGSGLGEIFVSGNSGSSDHMGGGPNQFANGVQGYIAFRIDDGSSGFYYGWMSVTLNDDGNSGTINGWAWENSGGSIQVGQIPEPSSFALVLIASLGLLRRRRK